MYLTQVKAADAAFQKRFGPWPRYDPAHAPHYMQKFWLQQLQDQLTNWFKETSAAHFK
jgi:hypothetical protein